jgi:hypothetical protein
MSGSYVDAPESYSIGGSVFAPAHDAMHVVPGAAQSAYVLSGMSRNTDSSQRLLELFPAGATTYQLDVGSVQQPWLTAISYTKATRTIAVDVGGGGQTFDLVDYHVWFGSASNPLTWHLFSPTLTDVVLPLLPADLDPGTFFFGGVGVETYEVPMLSGWDAVRPQVYPITTPQTAPVLPFGRVHIQSLRDQ